ncbi:adenosine deaminase [Oceanimonas baumannii]|uniref:Adenine deaminase n=1 Tax=Oceanimonas baumannii TaxID=129578 RepID=A0A235CH86_9GAMM|nr:adenosine deaminase [Oceanimonas baumannii]MCC4265763.1 adenosine deaminase [Oceanimonas baumannii]OYD23981.1 adenosine deaminase [Oceanimonas baumannii]TDW58685.1 adenosine deaminase [Oceanimonas baumannii]
MSAFIEQLPKVELHLHIEGSLEPELVFALARRNGITLDYANEDALRAAYEFDDLQSFLNIYYAGMSVLQTEQDFFDMTHAYLRRAHNENVRHTEIFFDPQAHTERGVPFSAVVTGIHRALEQARYDWGISSRLILSFLRHLPEESAIETLRQAEPFHAWLTGVGLDSSETGNPPDKFRRAYALAREQGYRLVAHAGEEGPPQYIRDAIALLRVERIDHGVAAIQDPALMAELAESRMPLTVCPLSNLKLRVVNSMSDHPMRTLLQAGLCVTVNSDDPAYFGGYMNANYMALQQGLAMTDSELLQLAANGVEASWLSPEEKALLLRDVREHGEKFGVYATTG